MPQSCIIHISVVLATYTRTWCIGMLTTSVSGSKNLATSPVLSNRRLNKLRYTHTVEYYISYQNNYSDMQREMILQNVILNLKRLHIACLMQDYLKCVWGRGRGLERYVGGTQNSLIFKHQQTSNSDPTNNTGSWQLLSVFFGLGGEFTHFI